MNTPGLKIMVPSTPSDAKGLLRQAIDMDDPVLSFEACILWGLKEDVEESEYRIPFGKARTLCQGSDVTVVGISTGVHAALQAARQLETQGISIDVIDPRTLVPLDSDAILNSVARTGRLVIVDPAHRTCGAAAEISAIVCEQAMQIPFSPAIEKQLYPDAEKTVAAVHRVLGLKATASA
jgi:pyruvate dehydrogenase E1 component beta subunit